MDIYKQNPKQRKIAVMYAKKFVDVPIPDVGIYKHPDMDIVELKKYLAKRKIPVMLENKIEYVPIPKEMYKRDRLYNTNMKYFRELMRNTVPVYDAQTDKYSYIYKNDIDAYVDKILEGYVPFQSRDMTNIVESSNEEGAAIPHLVPRIKYIKISDRDQYVAARARYRATMKPIWRSGILFDMPSDIDMFDMAQRDGETKFKFLNQLCPEIVSHQAAIPHAIGAMMEGHINFAFVPVNTDTASITLFTGMNGFSSQNEMLSNNIYIFGEKKMLESLRKEDDAGELIFNLSYYFHLYDLIIEKYNYNIVHIIALLDRYSVNNRVIQYKLIFMLLRLYDQIKPPIAKDLWINHVKNLPASSHVIKKVLQPYSKEILIGVASMIAEDYNIRWAPDARQIAEYLWERDETIRWIGELARGLVIDKTGSEYTKILYDFCKHMTSMNDIDTKASNMHRIAYYYDQLKLSRLASNFAMPITDDQVGMIVAHCHDEYYFSPQDIPDAVSNDIEQCGLIIGTVDDATVKGAMEKILETTRSPANMNRTTLLYDERRISTMKAHPVTDTFKLYPEFMPELTAAIRSDNYRDMIKYRQTVLADFSATWALRLCSLFVIGDPFITKQLRVPNITWNTNLNRVLLPCVLDRDMIFPLRIVNDDLFAADKGISMYQSFRSVQTEKKKFLGTCLINVSGRDNRKKFYTIYVFYKMEEKEIFGYDFRGNVVLPGRLVQNVKMLYTELNTIKYAKDYLGYDLFYYRIKGDTLHNLLVSKMNMADIAAVCKEKGYPLSVTDLVQCDLHKDENTKKFYLKTKQTGGYEQIGGYEQTGGYGEDECSAVPYDKEDTHLMTFELRDNQPPLDPEIVVDDIYYLGQITVSKLSKIDIEKPGIMSSSYSSTYLTPIRRKLVLDILSSPFIIDKLSPKQLTNIDKLKMQIKKIVFKNNFETYMSMAFYIEIKKMQPSTDSAIVFSYNTSLLTALVNYVHYDLNGKIDVQYYRPYSHTQEKRPRNHANMEFLQKNNIVFTQLGVLTSTTIQGLVETTKNAKLIIIDAIVYLGTYGNAYIYRMNYAYRLFFCLITAALQRLDAGGNLFFVMPPMGKMYIYDMVMDICALFDDFAYFDIPGICDGDHSQNNAYVLKGYHGLTENVMRLLHNINDLHYDIDQYNGYAFDVANVGARYPVSMYSQKSRSRYGKYKEWLKVKIHKNIIDILELDNTITNIKVGEIIMRLEMAYLETFTIAKKLNLEIADWVHDEAAYFKNIVALLEGTHVSGIMSHKQYGTTSPSSQRSDISSQLKNIRYLAESVYQYVEMADPKKYSSAELYFNNLYKNLNKTLAVDYHITIQASYVSRAWIKMYELLTVTNFFSNIDGETVTGFQICEAPGNFVACIKYFLEKRNKTYDWHAQSLKDSQVFDQYGFIENNPSRWDFGVDGTGDIMSKNNLTYYANKYRDVDVVIGDCGEKWSDETVVFAAMQLVYVLLILRVGGNFIIKTFAGNTNALFLSLLEVVARSFGDVYYYKSPINFWSHEIYICGKGYRGVDDAMRDKLFGAMDHNRLEPISDEVFKDYYGYCKNVIHVSSIYKKFFVFCANNYGYVKRYDAEIKKIVQKKNDKWIKFYITNGT